MSGFRPGSPEGIDVTKAWIERYLDGVHTAFPARVQSYDGANQVADLEPLVRSPVLQPDGSVVYEDLPMLPSVPVLLPRSAGWFIGLPLGEGDTVLVVCCEVAIGHWRAGDGSPQYPGDLRRHHLAHAVAIPGLFVRSAALGHAPPSPSADGAQATDPAIVIGSDGVSGTRVILRQNGELEVVQGSTARIKIEQGGDVVLRGGSTPVAKEGSSTSGHMHSLTGSAGPYPLSGTAITTTDSIASGAGSQNVKVP